MSKGRQEFKQSSSKLMRLAEKNNIRDYKLRVERDGSVELIVQQKTEDEPLENGRPNSFDQVLDSN